MLRNVKHRKRALRIAVILIAVGFVVVKVFGWPLYFGSPKLLSPATQNGYTLNDIRTNAQAFDFILESEQFIKLKEPDTKESSLGIILTGRASTGDEFPIQWTPRAGEYQSYLMAAIPTGYSPDCRYID